MPRLEDMNRLYVWQFLREEEDWTYRNGGLESSHIYFKKGTPRDAEIGVHIFRSLEEVMKPYVKRRWYTTERVKRRVGHVGVDSLMKVRYQ